MMPMNNESRGSVKWAKENFIFRNKHRAVARLFVNRSRQRVIGIKLAERCSYAPGTLRYELAHLALMVAYWSLEFLDQQDGQRRY